MNAIDLRLSLPGRAPPSTLDFDARPAAVERWLDDLPILNIDETSRMLGRALVTLNRMPLDDAHRQQVLELFRRPVAHVSQELQKQYLGMPLPLPDKYKQIATQVRQFQVEMAYGYKLIANTSAQADKNGVTDKPLVASVIQRAMSYLGQVLLKSFELYSSPPEGTWREIHQLYRFAEILGIIDAPVDDPLNTSVRHSSVGHVYKQALLLDFSDPYHLPARMAGKIHRYLDRWASLAQVSLAIAALKPNCQFLINLDNDRAGGVNSEASPITTEMRYRLLTTVELARKAHQQLTLMQEGRMPDPEGLDDDFFSNHGYDMLLRLINAWGVNPKRIFPRIPRRDRQFDLVSGVEAVAFFINGEMPFAASTLEVGPQPQRATVRAHGGAQNKVHKTSTPHLNTPWDQLDESAGGFALAKVAAPAEFVRVGDLIATRPRDGKNTWGIGVVRWAKTSGSQNVEIGVQRLSPAARAVAVMTLESREGEFLLALLLPEIKPMRQPQTLIVQRGLFKPGRLLYLDDGYGTQQIRAKKLIELSSSFERFQFDTLEISGS